MLPAPVKSALEALTAITTDIELGEAARERWRAGANGVRGEQAKLSDAMRAAADELAAALPALTKAEPAALVALLESPEGEVVFAWCEASTWRRDTSMALVLAAAAARPAFSERAAKVARERVVLGPLLDAIACAPLLGDGTKLALPENAEARARLEILVWEAGACALEVPALGKWIWSSSDTFDAMIREPAHGALRGRVLAARCLEIAVGGMPPMTDPELSGRTLQALQPLLLHPEPLVWVHAARALGRLTGPMQQLEGTVLDWVLSDNPLLRQRALTAFASMPAERLAMLSGQLAAIVASPTEDAWVLGAIAAATPHLYFERNELWKRLAKRILAGDGGAVAARALARGLATLWRRGMRDAAIETPLRALRELGRQARPTALDEARRWIEVIAVTDTVDGAERDPLDLELGLENLVRIAAQYDDEEADARSARFANALAPSFQEARRIALGAARAAADGGAQPTRTSLRQRAAAINALEGTARAFALRLWAPLLATRPAQEPIEQPNLDETWNLLSAAPAEILDLVKERRAAEDLVDLDDELPLEVLAIRLGGYALDACGEDSELGRGRGPTAHATCRWLRKIEGLADGSRDMTPHLESALSTLFWRLVDTTRGTALGEVDDVEWLGPFAAWWGLVIDRPAMLLQLGTALPMMAAGALEKCCTQADALRAAVSNGAADGAWGPAAAEAIASLHAQGTELASALQGLARALASFGAAGGALPNLEALCTELVLAGDRMQAALADPVKALHAPIEEDDADSLRRKATENAPRVAALVARAIRAREPSMIDVWLASLGPVTSGLLEAAVRGAIRRTPPAPPQPKKVEPKLIEGYELIKPLGEGGIGTVWLVRKPGADRYFVLKIPKAEALQNANDVEREGILKSFIEEANALAGMYHPNVANIIDRGVSSNIPFLVLEYLIGADLKQYSDAHRMSLYELRQVVVEACAGLAALHGAGLVHRDIKPANLWLRLPLAGGVRFDPAKHRDPALATPLATVVIDFGMVRAIRVPQNAAGRFVAGTPGYIAPEQVLDPVELDPRSDVYALAGTIYNVTMGRSFFDDIQSPRDRIIAHMRQDPFEDPERLRGWPVAIAKLLRAATALEPKDRPSPLEFGREFAAAL
ncbi:MAG TPA: serine/threonine-protein kinase [Polyangiaceae bacterium]|nr:serine/threonine-protein kinase [Polyangiaceae bacterium]